MWILSSENGVDLDDRNMSHQMRLRYMFWCLKIGFGLRLFTIAILLKKRDFWMICFGKQKI